MIKIYMYSILEVEVEMSRRTFGVELDTNFLVFWRLRSPSQGGVGHIAIGRKKPPWQGQPRKGASGSE